MPNESITQTILATVARRGPEKSTCPSEVARMLFPADWRQHMEAVRAAAIDLQQQGKVVITQKGEPIDITKIKGPIRIQLP